MLHKKVEMRRIAGILEKKSYFICFILFFLCHLFIIFFLPLTPDEAYYWLWSQSLQLGYPDHPPLIAYWIRGGTVLFGENVFGIRFFSVCAGAETMFFLWRAGAVFFGEDSGKWASILFGFTLFSNITAVTATPDTGAVLFLSTILWITSHVWKTELAEEKSVRFPLFFLAFFASLGFLTKYSFILPILGIYLALFFQKRELYARKDIYISFLLFALFILPNILWSFHHQGAAFAKQGQRFFMPEGQALSHYLELIAGQAGLITPVIFYLIFWKIFAGREAHKTKIFLMQIALPGIVFFSLYPLHARVQANWPFILWPILILMAGLATQKPKILACLTGFICIAGISIQAFWHFLPLNAHADPILRQSAGWSGLAEALKQKAGEGTIIETPDYALGAILSYHLRHSTMRIASSDPKLQTIRDRQRQEREVRTLYEIRKEGDKQGKDQKFCRYRSNGKKEISVRCYILEKPQIKKISFFYTRNKP